MCVQNKDRPSGSWHRSKFRFHSKVSNLCPNTIIIIPPSTHPVFSHRPTPCFLGLSNLRPTFVQTKGAQSYLSNEPNLVSGWSPGISTFYMLKWSVLSKVSEHNIILIPTSTHPVFWLCPNKACPTCDQHSFRQKEASLISVTNQILYLDEHLTYRHFMSWNGVSFLWMKTAYAIMSNNVTG